MILISSYAPQGNAERLIATGRVVLGVFSLLAISLDPSNPDKYAKLTYGLLVGYVAYAVILAYLVLRLPKPPGRLPFFTHVFDLIVFSVLMYLTQRPTSPFFAYFVFSIVCATVRWQWRGTLWTGMSVLAVFIGFGIYSAKTSHDPTFELNRFVIRCVYLGVLATLLGYLGIYYDRRRSQISRIAAWPYAIPLEEDAVVRDVLEHAANIFGAQRVLMAWEEVEEPYLYLALWSAGKYHLTREPPGTFQPLVAEELADNDFFCRMISYSIAHESPSMVRRLPTLGGFSAAL